MGSLLFQGLLGGEVGQLFNRVQGAFEKNLESALRLRLHFPPWEMRTWPLQSLPWELLYHAEDRRFFALSRRMPVVRSLDTTRSFRVLPAAPPLRILIAMANPPGTDLLRLSAERKKIEEALSLIDRIQVVVLEQATPQELRLRLRDKPFFHIVHFMGHGVGFNERSGEGALFLDSPGGEVIPLSATGIAEFFEDLAAPRLVVLNACETAATSEGVNPVRSVAASLVVAGLPAVLALRTAIQDDAALILAQELYRRLAQGDPIEAAVAEARQALRLERWGPPAWAIPALFVRPDPAGVLPLHAEPRTKETTHALPREQAMAPSSLPPYVQGAFGLRDLRTLFLLAASAGSLLPGFAFFLDLSPPLLPEVKLLPALAAAAVAIAFVWPRKRREVGERYKRELLRAVAIVLVSLFFVLCYIVFYRATTVSPPVPPPTITCQIGLGLTYLTESARQFMKSHPALANPQDLMLAHAAFAGC